MYWNRGEIFISIFMMYRKIIYSHHIKLKIDNYCPMCNDVQLILLAE